MTDRKALSDDTLKRLWERSEALKHTMADWLLMARAAEEIERLREEVKMWKALAMPDSQ